MKAFGFESTRALRNLGFIGIIQGLRVSEIKVTLTMIFSVGLRLGAPTFFYCMALICLGKCGAL